MAFSRPLQRQSNDWSPSQIKHRTTISNNPHKSRCNWTSRSQDIKIVFGILNWIITTRCMYLPILASWRLHLYLTAGLCNFEFFLSRRVVHFSWNKNTECSSQAHSINPYVYTSSSVSIALQLQRSLSPHLSASVPPLSLYPFGILFSTVLDSIVSWVLTSPSLHALIKSSFHLWHTNLPTNPFPRIFWHVLLAFLSLRSFGMSNESYNQQGHAW